MNERQREVEIEALERAEPYIRMVVALLMCLRWGGGIGAHTTCYKEADKYIDQLRKDIQR